MNSLVYLTDDLPDDVLYIIFEQLNLVDIVNLSVCSKRFNRLCREVKCDELYNINPKKSYMDNVQKAIASCVKFSNSV